MNDRAELVLFGVIFHVLWSCSVPSFRSTCSIYVGSQVWYGPWLKDHENPAIHINTHTQTNVVARVKIINQFQLIFALYTRNTFDQTIWLYEWWKQTPINLCTVKRTYTCRNANKLMTWTWQNKVPLPAYTISNLGQYHHQPTSQARYSDNSPFIELDDEDNQYSAYFPPGKNQRRVDRFGNSNVRHKNQP